ncbi:ABC transporter permease [Lachnospiraceae bacterium AM48-27BH]|jgi:ABC-type antimicrobial peptide transport system permease subunit|nr:ABC transporter permease [Lachnospiraceae bacterium AM48-27BH]
MRFLDLLTMSINNLRRRKVRTALTVLGVVIGTASVVVMVSLGIGLNALMMEMYSSYGSMTAIEIYNYGNNGNNGTSDNPLYLTDDTVKEFLRIPHVTSASPVLETNVILKQGVYETNTSINGVTREFMEQIPLGQGKLPDPKSTEMEFIYGNAVVQWFQNSKTGKGYWDTQELPDIDYMNKPMFVIFDTDAYYQSRSGGSGDGTPVKAPKKYLIRTAGVVEGGIDDYNSYAYGVYTDIDQLKTQLKKIYKKNPIPGQPTNKKGKPYSYFIYNQAYVYVDDMENVTAVQKAITDMGFQANSQMEWIEQSQQTYNMIQLVLGGIGAISLFVAAIGIANTMMMSIYERTKEIGVIKVLGCDLRTIRNMFLLESGFIGFMGGVIGVAISYGIGFIMNHFLGIGQIMTGQAGDISRIPLWLATAAVVFAIFVGMAAGFFPSLRAMHLSPLAAIRNE